MFLGRNSLLLLFTFLLLFDIQANASPTTNNILEIHREPYSWLENNSCKSVLIPSDNKTITRYKLNQTNTHQCLIDHFVSKYLGFYTSPDDLSTVFSLIKQLDEKRYPQRIDLYQRILDRQLGQHFDYPALTLALLQAGAKSDYLSAELLMLTSPAHCDVFEANFTNDLSDEQALLCLERTLIKKADNYLERFPDYKKQVNRLLKIKHPATKQILAAALEISAGGILANHAEFAEYLLSVGASPENVNYIEGIHQDETLCQTRELVFRDKIRWYQKHGLPVPAFDLSYMTNTNSCHNVWCEEAVAIVAQASPISLEANREQAPPINNLLADPALLPSSSLVKTMATKTNVHHQDTAGNTPLHHLFNAYSYDDRRDESLMMARHLLDAGANLHIKNNQGETPLSILQREKRLQRVKEMVEKEYLENTPALH